MKMRLMFLVSNLKSPIRVVSRVTCSSRSNLFGVVAPRYKSDLFVYTIIFFINMLLEIPSAFSAPSLALGVNHLCVSDGITGRMPTCLSTSGSASNTPSKKLDVPSHVKTVKKLSAGAMHSCAIYRDPQLPRDLIECWGDNRLHQLDHPRMDPHETAFDLVSGHWFSCALIASPNKKRVECWGAPQEKTTVKPEDLQNPTAIEYNYDHVCVTDSVSENDIKIFCWGSTLNGRWPGKNFGVSVGRPVWCSEIYGVLECKTQTLDLGDPRKPKINVVRKVGALNLYAALQSSDDGIIALNFLNSPQSRDLLAPEKGYFSKTILKDDNVLFSGFTDFRVNETNLCYIAKDGLSCFNREGELKPFKLKNQYLRNQLYFEIPSDIYPILMSLIPHVYSFDKLFLQDVTKLLENATPEQQAFAAKAFSHYLNQFPYQGFADVYMSRMTDSIKNVLTDEWTQTLQKKEDIQFALSIIASSIRTMRPVLLRVASGPKVQGVKEAEELVALIAQSIGDPKNLEDLKKKIEEFARPLSSHDYVGERITTILWINEHLP